MAKILIIEDQEPLCNLYNSVLSKFDHETLIAMTGEAGVETALSERPDLVILDLLLPGIPGVEVAQKLRDAGIFPSTPLIITTALDEMDTTVIANSLSASAVLIKPFNIVSILETVNRVLDLAGTGASPRVHS